MMPMRDVRGVVRDVTADAPITVIDRGGQVFNVRAFGAKGDGVSDDTAAMASAVAAAQASTNKGVIYFPPGGYVGSLRITSSSVSLLGDGSAVILGTDPTKWVVEFVGGSHNGIDGINILFSGVQNNTVGGLHVSGCQMFTARRMTIGVVGNAPYNGMRDDASYMTRFDGLIISQCPGYGAQFNQSSNPFLSDTVVGSCGSGFIFDGLDGGFAENIQTTTCTQGFVFQKTGAAGNINVFMMNCVGDNSANNNWSITNLIRGMFTNCWGSTNSSLVTYPNACGCYINGGGVGNVQYLEFTNGTFANNNFCGMDIIGASDIRVNGGSYDTNNRAASGGDGINANTGSVGITVRGVRALSNRYGVVLDTGVDFGTITDCDLRGNTTGPLAIVTPSVNIVTKDNKGYNPHAVPTPSVPLSTVAANNTTGVDVTAYIKTDAGTTVSALSIDGTLTNFTMAVSSQLAVHVPVGGSITMTYAGGTPTWTWIGE